jgi:hypothetical protein
LAEQQQKSLWNGREPQESDPEIEMRTLSAAILTLAVCIAQPAFACVTAVERTGELLTPDAQTRTWYVTAPYGCNWYAQSSEPFLQILSKPSSGGGTLTYRVTANPYTTLRGAQIFIPNFSLNVQQSGAATPKPFRGDINGDGYTDAFWTKRNASNYDQVSYGVWWGAATQSTANRKELITNQEYGHIVASGSFSGDGHASFVLYEPRSRWVRMVFVGEAGQTTVEPVWQMASAAWEIVGAGDFNGDYKSDLLLRNVQDRLLSVWFMDGAELIDGPVVTPPIVSYEWQVAGIADFDGDNKSDILLRHIYDNTLSVWLMDGATATDTPLLEVSLPLPWRLVDVGDFNGDGQTDLVHVHRLTNEIRFTLLDGLDVLSTTSNTAAIYSGQPLSIADVNSDGKDDVVFQIYESGTLQRSYFSLDGSRTGMTNYPENYPVSRYRRAATRSDFNGDTRSDLLLRNTATNDVATWELNGPSLLRSDAFATVAPGWRLHTIAPFSGDLMSDLQLLNGGFLSLWELAGQDILDSNEIEPAIGLTVAAAGDFDGDGNADLLLEDGWTREYEVWLMEAHRGVRERVPAGNTWDRFSESHGTIVGVGDYLGTGRDVVLLTYPSTYALTPRNDAIPPVQSDSTTLNPFFRVNYQIHQPRGLADVNGDGREDLIYGDTQIRAYRHDNSSNPPGPPITDHFTLGSDDDLQAAGDYDGDGRAEYIIRSRSTGTVSMWRQGPNGMVKTPFAQVISPQWIFTGQGGSPIPPSAESTSPNAAPTSGFSLLRIPGKTRTSRELER